jgi:hypothetical protein
VDRDLCLQGIVRERVLAVALLDYGVFRTGDTEYAGDRGSRGAATLNPAVKDMLARVARLLTEE